MRFYSAYFNTASVFVEVVGHTPRGVRRSTYFTLFFFEFCQNPADLYALLRSGCSAGYRLHYEARRRAGKYPVDEIGDQPLLQTLAVETRAVHVTSSGVITLDETLLIHVLKELESGRVSDRSPFGDLLMN